LRDKDPNNGKRYFDHSHDIPADAELIRAFREEHKEAALVKLMLRYRFELLLFFRHHHFIEEDAEDLLQETWAAVFVHFSHEDFHLTGPFNFWLFRIAKAKMIDAIRKRKRRPRLDREDKVPDEKVHCVKFDYNFLIGELNKVLTPREKDVFIRYAIEGMSDAQIGEVLGIEEHTVSNYYSNARKKLIAHFEALGIKGWEP
jgi:RNA polymerase sigma factor (sigma-70 family)